MATKRPVTLETLRNARRRRRLRAATHRLIRLLNPVRVPYPGERGSVAEATDFLEKLLEREQRYR